MSAELYVDNWDDIARRRGFRPEVIERVHRIKAQRDAGQLAEMEKSRAVAKLRARFAPSWAVRIILEVADERQVSPADITGECRTYPVVKARNEAVYRVKDAKQTLSSTQIAGWFGRDHTTILYSMAAHAHEAGLPQLCGYNLERSRTRNKRARKEAKSLKIQAKSAILHGPTGG